MKKFPMARISRLVAASFGAAAILTASAAPLHALECAGTSLPIFSESPFGGTVFGTASSLNGAYKTLQPHIEEALAKDSGNLKLFFATDDKQDFFAYEFNRERTNPGGYIDAMNRCGERTKKSCVVFGAILKGKFYCLAQPGRFDEQFAPFKN